MAWLAFPAAQAEFGHSARFQKEILSPFFMRQGPTTSMRCWTGEAIRDSRDLPPWKNLTFKASGRTYYFPFRLRLKPLRSFNEPLVRAEFSYVAENLLLRGGYRKTHFQADQTTLQSVSQMGTLFEGSLEQLLLPEYSTFEPSFTHDAKHLRIPEVFKFQEKN